MQYEVVEIKLIKPEQTWPLRSKVLRNGLLPLEKNANPLDHHPDAFHLGAILKNNVVGIASIQKESLDHTHLIPSDLTQTYSNLKNPYRLRGMAVDPEYQNLKIGEKLVLKAIEVLQEKNCELFWFNARVKAKNFYQRLGFHIHSELFMIEGLPEIGAHYLMAKKL